MDKESQQMENEKEEHSTKEPIATATIPFQAEIAR